MPSPNHHDQGAVLHSMKTTQITNVGIKLPAKRPRLDEDHVALNLNGTEERLYRNDFQQVVNCLVDALEKINT